MGFTLIFTIVSLSRPHEGSEMKTRPIVRTIGMTVLNDDDFISEYRGNTPVISEGVAGYLNNAI